MTRQAENGVVKLTTSRSKKIHKSRKVLIVAYIATKHPARKDVSKDSKQRHKQVRPKINTAKVFAVERQKIASVQVQRKIFNGDIITFGDGIGSRLVIECPEWKPAFYVGGTGCGHKEKGDQ